MTVQVGAKAPDFSLTGIDGTACSLADALNRGPLVLVFFKATCATCDLALPYVNRMAAAYPSEGWSLWAVAQDRPEEAQAYAATLGMDYPVLPDAGGYPTSKAYDPPATPTVFLIDRGGEVVQASVGFNKRELNSLSDAIAERLGVEPVVIAPAGDGNPDSKPG